jgi:hypothetical protein
MQKPADAVRAPTTTFEGYVCPTGLPLTYLPFLDPAYVFVSGSGGNPYGHCLLDLGHASAAYGGAAIGFVHSAAIGNNPAWFIPSEKFEKYMTENGKKVWDIRPIQLPNVQAAANLTNQYLTQGFTWVPWCNCVTMVDLIANAGGSAYVANTVFPDNATAAIQPGFQKKSLLDAVKGLFKL